MQGRYSKFINAIHLLGDILLMNFSYFYVLKKFVDLPGDVTIILFINLIWIIVANTGRIYEINRIVRIEKVIFNLLKTILFHSLLISTIIFFLNLKLDYPNVREYLFLTYAVFTVLVFFWRLAFTRTLKIYRRLGFNYKTVAIIGAGPVGNALMEFFNSDLSHGYKFKAFFDDNPEKCLHQELIAGNLDQVKEYALANNLDEIY
ncbi:MAG: hypothetical protein IH946_05450, partial [Bacteroidetes bacterium]|nr:hypothetical protein [Bacteroidota bacterium]